MLSETLIKNNFKIFSGGTDTHLMLVDLRPYGVTGKDAEESLGRAGHESVNFLYGNVRKIHFKMYFHYLYFNAVKWSYLQGMVIVPYLALAPTIVTGATLGFVQQIARAFNKVENSLQYLVRSWPIIVELISVWKRLNEFENKLKDNLEKTTI